MLTDDDQAVTLLLTLDGRSAASLRDFAVAEDIDVSMAGLIYLDQVVCRISAHTDDIETISTSGSDAVGEIFHVLQQRPVNRVIVPASLPGLDAGGLARLLQVCPVPVVVAPRRPSTARSFSDRFIAQCRAHPCKHGGMSTPAEISDLVHRYCDAVVHKTASNGRRRGHPMRTGISAEAG